MTNPFAAARQVVIELPVIPASTIWTVGKVPTAPIPAQRGGFVGLATDHYSRHSAAQPIQLVTSTIGVKNGLLTRRVGIRTQDDQGNKKMVLADHVGKRQIKAAFHSRGFAVPGKLKSDDLAVLAALRLPEPLATKPGRLIDIKKEWIRTPEWRQLKETLAIATNYARVGIPSPAAHNLKSAEEIARKLTGLSLRPEVVEEVIKEAEIRKDLIQIRSADLEQKAAEDTKSPLRNSDQRPDLQRDDIGTDTMPTHIRNFDGSQPAGDSALTDYLIGGDPFPMPPPLGDTMEERSGAMNPSGDLQTAPAVETLAGMREPVGMAVFIGDDRDVLVIATTHNLSPSGDADLIVSLIPGAQALMGTTSGDRLLFVMLGSTTMVYRVAAPELKREADAPEFPDVPRVEATGTETNADSDSGEQQSPWWDFLESILGGLIIRDAETMAQRK